MPKHMEPDSAEEQGATAVTQPESENDGSKADLPEQGLESALKEAEEKAQDHWDRYLRAAAELDNYRRRMQRELEAARKFGHESLAAEILRVKDSLEMGLVALGEQGADPEKLREGKEATLKLLSRTLEQFGVAEIDPIGQPFDPELHEAMSMQESDEAAPGSVLTVIQKGYRLHERLLRPARVIVARAPEEAETEPRDSSDGS